MDTTAPATHARNARTRSRRSRALVAAGITGAVTVAGSLSAGAASAAEVKPAVRAIDPALQDAVRLPYPGGGGGGCIVCGLGGFDPIFGPAQPGTPYGGI